MCCLYTSLTETAEGLQAYMQDLQTQMEDLRSAQAERSKRDLAEQRRSLGAQSVSCLKELYDLQQDRCVELVCVCVELRCARPFQTTLRRE